MNSLRLAARAASVCAMALMMSNAALAQGTGHGGHGGHAGHGAMAAPAGDAETAAPAVVHSVDAAAGKINVTHDPIPAIGWPKMTMDLPVTKSVDLSSVKPGDKVTIVLKQGRDKQFRVVGIKAAQ